MSHTQPAAPSRQTPTAACSSEFTIGPLAARHLQMAVNVHIKAFPGFFLAWLGPRFLKQLYCGFLTDSAGVCVVATSSNGQVLGTVLGSTAPEGFYRRLLIRRWWVFASIGALAAARKPYAILRLARGLVYRGDPPADRPRALLDSISVDPQAQGRGVGKELVQYWLQAVKSKGSHGAFLTTDADNNEQVNLFYKSLGFTVESTSQRHDGRRMNRYVIDW
jgi:ribosomal protein S18 acetylase RimI-like enzyme